MPENTDQTNTATTSGEQQDQGTGTQAGKTFTQEQLDAIIADRLQRERAKYTDYEALKAAKGELDQIKAGQMTEAEKLKKAADEAAQRAQAAEARLRETVTRMEIERQARKLNIVDEDAAYRLLDASKIEYDKDGKPTNVEVLLKELVKVKPYLVAQASSGSPTNPARTGAGTSDAFTAALYRGAGLKKE